MKRGRGRGDVNAADPRRVGEVRNVFLAVPLARSRLHEREQHPSIIPGFLCRGKEEKEKGEGERCKFGQGREGEARGLWTEGVELPAWLVIIFNNNYIRIWQPCRAKHRSRLHACLTVSFNPQCRCGKRAPGTPGINRHSSFPDTAGQNDLLP